MVLMSGSDNLLEQESGLSRVAANFLPASVVDCRVQPRFTQKPPWVPGAVRLEKPLLV